MVDSNIKKFISIQLKFNKPKKVWIPIIWTFIFLSPLVNEYIQSSYETFEIVSFTLFRSIFILAIWFGYFSSNSYSRLDNLIENKGDEDVDDFTEEEEITFSEKSKKFTTVISISVITLFVFEILRIFCLLFSVSSTFINIIYVLLIVIGVVCLALSAVMYKRMYNYIKTII